MGVLRLLFAISVVIFHAGLLFGYNIANQNIAVLSFFIISGFYISLILDKKYIDRKNAHFLFITNRFLRIFPLYWVILLVTFLFVAIKFYFHLGAEDNAIVHYLKYLPHTSVSVVIFTIINYVLRNFTLIFTTDYFFINDNTSGYLLVQQAWTLQVELLFYLLAPLLVKASNKIFLLFFAVYLVGVFGIVFPFHLVSNVTITYVLLRNLLFFLLGMTSYRFLYKKIFMKQIKSYVPIAITLFFLIYVVCYNVFPFKYPLQAFSITDILYFFVFTCSLPFIFFLTSYSSVDMLIGELSYPVYITHFFIIKLLSNITFFKNASNMRTVVIIICTLGVSLLAVKLINKPIDRFRQRRLLAGSVV